MKRFLLSLCALFFFSFASVQAQIGPGLFAGGALGFNQSSGESKITVGSTTTTISDPVTSNFTFAPRVGYFFTDNIGAGIYIPYNLQRTVTERNQGDEVAQSSEFGVGIFGRYAIGLGDEERFAFFSDLSFGIVSGSSKTTFNNTTTDGPSLSGIDLGLSAGFVFFPTEKVGIEASLGNIFGYSSRTRTTVTNTGFPLNTQTTTEQRTNSLDLFNLSSLSFNLGFNYYFSR